MDLVHDSAFVVFVRVDRRHEGLPERMERPLATCATYEEARQIQLAYRRASRECVIRYLGIAGGGD